MNLKTLLCCAAAALAACPVDAMPYIADNPADIQFDASHPFYSGTFDITAAGFDPITQYVSSATVWFETAAAGSGETLNFGLGVNGMDMMGVGGAHVGISGLYQGYFTLGTTDRVSDLSQDGRISYSITQDFGTFWVYDAKLEAYATARVSDATSSAVLFAVGLIGLQLLRRRVSVAPRQRANSGALLRPSATS